MNPLAIFGEVRTQAKSIKERYEKVQENPERFQSLKSDLDRLVSDIAKVERLFRAFPNALPEAIVDLFNRTLEHVQSNFIGENANMPTRLQKGFGGSSSSCCISLSEVKITTRQVTRAKDLSREMDAVQKKIETASNQLQPLVTVMSNALEAKETRALVGSKIDGMQSTLYELVENVMPELAEMLSTLCDMVENAQEVYTPVINAPRPSPKVRLDFGNESTPEGLLKKVCFVL